MRNFQRQDSQKPGEDSGLPLVDSTAADIRASHRSLAAELALAVQDSAAEQDSVVDQCH